MRKLTQSPRRRTDGSNASRSCAGPASSRPLDSLQRTLGNEATQQLIEGALPRADRAFLAPRHDGQSSVRDALRSPARPLAPDIRADMEARFHHDFGSVQIHTGPRASSSADAMNAKAYTVGNHIVFADGRYAPWNAAGRLLLAHELAHAVQQRRGGAPPGAQSDSHLEVDAGQAAAAAVHGNEVAQVQAASGIGVARQELTEDERKRLMRQYEARLARVRGRLVPNPGGAFKSYHVKGSGTGHGGQPGAAPGGGSKPKAPAAPPGSANQGDPAGQSDRSQPGSATGTPGGKTPGGAGASPEKTGTRTGPGQPLTELDYAVKLAGIVNLEFGDDDESVSGGIPGGHGGQENASEAGQALYAALAAFDVINIAKSLWSLGKAAFKKGAEEIAARIAGKALTKGAAKEAEAKLIREGLEKAVNKNAYIGKRIIGWGERGTAEAVAQTLKLGETLTEESVRDMIAKGLTKEWVQTQLAQYEGAVLRGTLDKNPLLNPRRLLMRRILELWPK